jgi:PAS domain S-box-containing protein
LRAQTALRDSEARFRTLVESQGEGVSLIDPEENCLFANPAANTIFGVDSLFGRNLRDFMSHAQFVQLRTQTDRRRRGERSTYDLEIIRPDGERRNLIVTATPQLDAAGSFVGALTVWMDITERKRAEEQLKVSLLEKEVLLKEIHHRVKNNLQVVHSLLNLQSNQISDAASLEVLRDSQNRVRSMALVHETLYRSPDLAQVDFAEYVSNLAAQLAQSYRIEATGSQLSVQASSEVRLGIDIALPCGLIINELVSNALKHAFPVGRTGTVTVRLARRSAEAVAMTVADDGIGLPPGFDHTQTESLGLQLVGQLVRQIRGCLTVQHDGGTQFTIEFQAHESIEER